MNDDSPLDELPLFESPRLATAVRDEKPGEVAFPQAATTRAGAKRDDTDDTATRALPQSILYMILSLPSMPPAPIIYLDTNVHSALVKEPGIRSRLTKLVLDLDGAGVGLSEANIMELQAATRIHRDLVDLLRFYPTTLLKLAGTILDEEVDAYPRERAGEIYTAVLFDPYSNIDAHPLFTALREPRLANAALEMRRQAGNLPQRHAELRDNFSPARSGKYERQQADAFADLITFQWVAKRHPYFARRIVEAGTTEISTFKSIRMHAYLLFWRFYLGRRTPNATSDLGDQVNARFYPYCRTVVLESDAADTLRQIQKHSNLLDDVEIMSLRDLRTYGDE